MAVKVRIGVWVALGVLLVGLVANSFVNRRQEGALADARDSVVVALRDSERSRALTDLLLQRTADAEARADSAEAQADTLKRLADVAKVKYDGVKAAAPAVCLPVISAADTLIARVQSRADSLDSALQSEREAVADMHVALDFVRASNARLEAAARVLVNVSAPSWREKLIPRFGVGAAAGVNPVTGRPAAAVGITVGWHF
jgi:hypothetical protein